MSNKTGLTLVELIVVLAIISVLTLISYSGSDRAREAGIGEKGRMDLILIFNSEKGYKLDNKGDYFYAGNTTDINSGLGLDLRTENFDYSVERMGADGFKAVAERNNGSVCYGKKMFLSSAGGQVAAEGDKCAVW